VTTTAHDLAAWDAELTQPWTNPADGTLWLATGTRHPIPGHPSPDDTEPFRNVTLIAVTGCFYPIHPSRQRTTRYGEVVMQTPIRPADITHATRCHLLAEEA